MLAGLSDRLTEPMLTCLLPLLPLRVPPCPLPSLLPDGPTHPSVAPAPHRGSGRRPHPCTVRTHPGLL